MSWVTIGVLGLLILTARLQRVSPWSIIYALFVCVVAMQVWAWEDRQTYYANWQRDWTTDSNRWARDLENRVNGSQNNLQGVANTLNTLCLNLPPGSCTPDP